MTNKKIAEYIGINEGTIYNWKKQKPLLYAIVMEYFKKNDAVTIQGNHNIVNSNISINGNSVDICNDICNEFSKLSDTDKRKFYFKFMAELSQLD